MKKISLLLFVLISSGLFAQDQKPAKVSKLGSKQDRLVLNLNLDNWQNASSGIDVKTFRSRGFSCLLMNEKIFGQGNFAFGFGLGFSSQNVHSNAFPTYDGSKTFLTPFPANVDYEVNKLSCNFIDAALEFRFRTNENKNKNRFKISPGIKGGILVQSHTKFDDGNVKMKTYRIKNLNTFQYGVTARISYGRWGVSGYYALVNLFKDGKGPEVVPVSVGLSFAL